MHANQCHIRISTKNLKNVYKSKGRLSTEKKFNKYTNKKIKEEEKAGCVAYSLRFIVIYIFFCNQSSTPYISISLFFYPSFLFSLSDSLQKKSSIVSTHFKALEAEETQN